MSNLQRIQMERFRLDRSAFSMRSHAQTEERNSEYWSRQPVADRFSAAAYLNSVAYGYPYAFPPRLDKTVHRARKR
ncbi:MAG: hypothetical protein O3C43_10150 [Verrucomicrobia bacterium]|nr:hypothetical protein [Verrucomicrobiota bacterium]